MYKCTYFIIEELVHPQILEDLGEINCWLRFDEDALRDLDIIRTLWDDGIAINGNYWGKTFVDSGARHPRVSVGATWSLHKLFKAFDLKPLNGEIKKFHKFVFDLIKEGRLKHFNAVENFKYTKGWCHIARMNTSEKPLVIRP